LVRLLEVWSEEILACRGLTLIYKLLELILIQAKSHHQYFLFKGFRFGSTVIERANELGLTVIEVNQETDEYNIRGSISRLEEFGNTTWRWNNQICQVGEEENSRTLTIVPTQYYLTRLKGGCPF